MTAPSKTGKWLEGRSVTLTREFDAPRALVFEAWSTAEHLSHWFGPRGFTVHDVVMDFRVGGKCNLVMVAPDGTRYPSEAIYLEIVAQERIVLASRARAGDGKLLFQTETIATFGEKNGKTTLTLESRVSKVFDSAAAAAAIGGMDEGWQQTLARLAAYVTDLKRR